MGLGKLWPDLEISEAFVIALKVSFLGDFASWSLDFAQVSVLNFEIQVLQSRKALVRGKAG